ncbi:hypothetical protein [Flavivirga aquimarina]
MRFSDYQIINDIDNVIRAIKDYILNLKKVILHFS